MDNLVITVARGFGSCGKRIAKQIADDLGIHCYENGVWSHNSRLHPNTLQLKLGLLCDDAFMDELFEKIDKGLAQALSK